MNKNLVDILAEYSFNAVDTTPLHFNEAAPEDKAHFRAAARHLIAHLRSEGYTIVARDPAEEALQEIYRTIVELQERSPTKAG